MKWHLSTTNNGYQYMCMWWTIGCTLCCCHWKKWWCVLVFITWLLYYEIFVEGKEVWAKMKLYKSSLLLVQMVWMFSRALYGVVIHIQEASPPFIWRVHCVFHWMNLVMHFFLKIPLVHWVEVLFQLWTHTFAKFPNIIWNLQNWLSWKLNYLRYWKSKDLLG